MKTGDLIYVWTAKEQWDYGGDIPNGSIGTIVAADEDHTNADYAVNLPGVRKCAFWVTQNEVFLIDEGTSLSFSKDGDTGVIKTIRGDSIDIEWEHAGYITHSQNFVTVLTKVINHKDKEPEMKFKVGNGAVTAKVEEDGIVNTTREFKVGDTVAYRRYEATIFGIANQEDFSGVKYAITYTDEVGDVHHNLVSGNEISKLEIDIGSLVELKDKESYGNPVFPILYTIESGYKVDNTTYYECRRLFTDNLSLYSEDEIEVAK